MSIKIGRKSLVKVVWDVKPIDYSRDKVNDIIENVSKKYNIPKKSVKVDPNFIRINENGDKISLTNDVVDNIQDPNFQIKLFEEYIKVNQIEDINFKQILDIDAEINSEIDFDVYDKFRRYSIEWLEWDNFLSYGSDNRMDFTTLKGLVLLNGEPINQSGKTTFAIDLLKFLLFGVTTKAKTLDKIFNRHVKDSTEIIVRGCISIDGEQYIIERIVTRPKKRTAASKASQQIRYFKVINGSYDPEKPLIDYNPKDLKNEGDEGKETNKIIKEAIGKEGDFDLIISATSKNLDDLIDVGDVEKGRLLNRWIGLLPIEEKDKIARDKFNKKISPTFLSNQYNVETLSSQILEYETLIETSKENIGNYEKSQILVDNKILTLDNEKLSNLNKKHNINQDIMKLNLSTLEQDLESITNKGKKCREDLNVSQVKIQQLSTIIVDEDELKSKRSEFTSISEKIVGIKYEINTLKEQNNNLKNSEFCPTCKRKYDNVDNTQQISDNENKINELTNEGITLNNNKLSLEQDINNLEELTKQITERNKEEVRESKLKVDLNNFTQLYNEKKQTINEFQQNKKDIDENNTIDAILNTIDATLLVHKKERDNLIKYIETENNNIKNYEKNILERNEIIKKLHSEQTLIRSWKLYLEMVGKNGISKMVLRNTLPIINGELDRMLNDICDFKVEINITDKNDVIFNIIVDDEVGELTSTSGYERTLAALALRTVLANISTMPRPNFIVFDEILGRVGIENMEKIKELYDKIVENYQFVIHICHNEEVKSWHNEIITVTKMNNVSRLIKQS